MTEPVKRCPRDPAHSHRPHAWSEAGMTSCYWCPGEVRCPTFHGMFPERKGPHGECCACPVAIEAKGES